MDKNINMPAIATVQLLASTNPPALSYSNGPTDMAQAGQCFFAEFQIPLVPETKTVRTVAYLTQVASAEPS
jgi:hypothetical protein